jgi:hypothetical protein
MLVPSLRLSREEVSGTWIYGSSQPAEPLDRLLRGGAARRVRGGQLPGRRGRDQRSRRP